MNDRIPPGQAGQRWLRQLPDRDAGCDGMWQAGVWVRDRDGRRRVVRVRAGSRSDAEAALDARLGNRVAAGAVGVTATMTVAELAEYYIQRRIEQSQAPVAGQARGGQGGPVSPQTIAGYQAAITGIVDPELGGLYVVEALAGILDEVLRSIAESGRSTTVVHTTLKQMFSLAVRHGAIDYNPMREVERPRRRRRAVSRLTVEQAHTLLALTSAHAVGHAVDPQGRRTGGPQRTTVVQDLVVFLLSTGCRIGEALAIRWRDLDLTSDPPTVRVAATMVEPRKQAAVIDRNGAVAMRRRVFVDKLHRQPITKGGAERALTLPDAAVAMLRHRRRHAVGSRRPDAPVFASVSGGWLSPSNQRAKLRTILAGTELKGVSPHVLRRTVGTLLAHECGLDVAREVLGHADTSVTGRHYVAAREVAPDVRSVLNAFFVLKHQRRAEP